MAHLSSLLVAFLLLPMQIPVALSSELSPAMQLQTRLADVRTMQATFTQITLDSHNKAIQSSHGTLWLREGGSFRIETLAPFEQTLVSDGVHFWSYEADLEQVVVSLLTTDFRRVPILLFGNDDADLLAEYDISFFMDDDMIAQYVLHPTRRDSLFEVLTIAFEDCKPAAISILDSLGQRTRIEFHDLVLNAPVADETFRFTAPDGVDVIDDR